MKMKLKASELHTYQQEADSVMKWIDVNYTNLLSPIYDNASVFRKAWVQFKALVIGPPSLRFYHFGEQLTRDEDVLHKAGIYRALWHDYWSVINLLPTVGSVIGEQEMLLDSYETYAIMNIRRYKEEIKTF